MADDYPEILSVECLRRPAKQALTPEEMDQKVEERTLDRTSQMVLRKAMEEGTDTVWDRLERQTPHCKFCSEGVSCQRCAMGPCRIMGGDRTRGVCGNDANLIVARNLLDWVAMGAAAHSDHGRDVVEALLKGVTGSAPEYTVTDVEKLNDLAKEYGIDTEGTTQQIAERLALAMLDEFGTTRGELQMIKRVPAASLEVMRKADILPRGIDREVVEAMHRIHMGVGNDPFGVVMHGFRTSMSDGWGGSRCNDGDIRCAVRHATEIKTSRVSPASEAGHVNVALHGHNPVLSEMIVRAAADHDIVARAKKVGAAGVNLAGLCCTGNELLMRKGVPQAGNHLDQELTIITGALEAMIVDYQCIFPSLPFTAACYHTKVFSTSPKATMSGAEYIEVTPENAYQQSKRMLEMAIDNYPNRIPEKVQIPDDPMEAMVGFFGRGHQEGARGEPEAIAGRHRGREDQRAVGIVGCNNPTYATTRGMRPGKGLDKEGHPGGGDGMRIHRVRQGRASCCPPRSIKRERG